MSKSSRKLTAILLGSVMAVSMVPSMADPGGGKMLKECLDTRKNEPNQQQVRSECRWEYYEYMASYGR